MRRVAIFYGIAFALTWSVEAVIIKRGGFVSLNLILLYGAGWCSPTFAAAVMAHDEGGWPAVRDLFRQILVWKLSPIYLVALLLPAATLLAGALLTGSAGLLGWGGLLGLVGPPLAEEPGWRGYALPRLHAAWGMLPATLVTAGLAALWHAPYWLIPGYGPAPVLIFIYLLWLVASGIVNCWFYYLSNRLLTAAVVFHAGLNLAIIPAAAGRAFVAATGVMTLVSAVALIYLGYRDRSVTRSEPR